MIIHVGRSKLLFIFILLCFTALYRYISKTLFHPQERVNTKFRDMVKVNLRSFQKYNQALNVDIILH